MAAELKIGIGADISSLTKAVSDAKGKIGDLSNIKLPEIKGPKVEMPKMIPMPPMPEIPPIEVPPIPPIKIPPIDDTAVDDFLDKIDKIKGVGEQLSSIGQKMSVGLTLPILALGGSAIKAYGDIQSLQKGLEAVMGSGAAAGKEFEKLKEVARLPGLGMEEAVKGSINLQAIGMDADRSRKILSQFGNAVASVGKGKAEFERAIYGVQQLANTDFPLGEDLNIIKDALPQVSNLLKEAFGTSRSDELAKMGVSSKQVLDTITAGLEKLPRVTGGINGAFENLGDSMKTSLARIGKIIDDTFDISGIIDKLTGYLDSAVSAFENLSPAVQKTILVVTGLVAAAGPLLVVIGGLMAALPSIIAGFGAVKVALVALTGPIGLVVVGVGAIIAAVVSNWSKITPYIRGTVEWFKRLYNESDLLRGAVNLIGLTFKAAFSVVGDILTGVWRSIKAFGKGILELFAGIGGVIEGALTLDFDKIKAGYSRGFGAIMGTASSFVTVFKDTVKNIGNSILNPTLSLPKINVSSSIDPSLSDKVADVVSGEVAKGLKKVKDKPLSVELPDIEPIAQSFNTQLENALGERFATLIDYENREKELHARMANNNVGLLATMSQGAADMAVRVAEFNSAVSQTLNQGVTDMITNGAMALGDALALGENVIGAVGKSLLSTFGGILVQLGKMAIAEGLALQAIQTALKSLNPYVALAAGVALVALGSAVSSSVSGLGSSMGRGGNSNSGGGGLSTGAGGGVANYTSSYSTGTGSNNEFRFVIMGDDLYSVMERAKAKHERLN